MNLRKEIRCVTLGEEQWLRAKARWRERTEFQNKEFSIVTSYLFGWRGQRGYRGTSWGAVNPATKHFSVSIPTRYENTWPLLIITRQQNATQIFTRACICGAFGARLNALFVQLVPSITQLTKFQLHTFVFTPTLLQHYILFCEELVSSVTSGFHRGVNESSLFWDVTQRILVISDVSEPICSIFKVKESKTNAYRARMSSVFIFLSIPFFFFFFHTFFFCLISCFYFLFFFQVPFPAPGGGCTFRGRLTSQHPRPSNTSFLLPSRLILIPLTLLVSITFSDN